MEGGLGLKPYMDTRRRFTLAAVLALALSFFVVIVRSVLRRAESTYNYPAYSSLNNSSDGIKAYFEALRALGYQTSRNYLPLHKLAGTRATVFFAGTSLTSFRYSDAKDLKQLEDLATQGGRILIAFDPYSILARSDTELRRRDLSKQPVPENTLKTRWGVELGFSELHRDSSDSTILTKLNFFRAVYWFASWNNKWVPLEVRDSHPQLLERDFGRGSILLISNASYFTNRALLLHPDAQLLAQVSGPRRPVIFDESHLGLEDSGTVTGLAVKHGLEWALLGFLVLAILYIWYSAISFVPRFPGRPSTTVAGRDAHSALTNLLMQSVPNTSILRVCAEEWNHSGKYSQGFTHPLPTEDLSRLSVIEPARAPDEFRWMGERVKSTHRG